MIIIITINEGDYQHDIIVDWYDCGSIFRINESCFTAYM